MPKPSVRLLSVLAAGASVLVIAAGCGQDIVTSDDNVEAGKQAFVSKCGSCHTLARADTKGTVGPNLDAAFQSAVADGERRTTIKGIVYQQILHPARLTNHSTGTQMPAGLVKGQDARDVAAYVAISAAKAGKDTGLLAEAVKAAGGGKPAVEKNGTLQIDADPGGQLAYVTKKATGQAGPVTLKMTNDSGTPHDLSISGNGVNAKTPVTQKGTVQAKATLKPGTYDFFCSVPGHRQAGMEGKLTVK
jgi:mono/diheme cytochrome c family protein